MKLVSLTIGSVAVLLSTAPALPTAAQDGAGLAPSTPWTVDYDTDSCALRRMFGEGERQVFFELRRFDRRLSLQAVVASSWMTARAPSQTRYRFGESGEWNEAGSANTLTLANGFSGVLFFPVLVTPHALQELQDLQEPDIRFQRIDVRSMEVGAAAATDSFQLRGAFSRTVELPLGPMDKPIEALHQCIDELMTHWGIDVEAHKTLSRPVRPINLREVGRMIDYPPQMLRQNMPGVVNIRLSVDERGRTTACHIQMPLSDPSFEETSCAEIQHAVEFEPALDKDGKPIASYWTTRVVFGIFPWR